MRISVLYQPMKTIITKKEFGRDDLIKLVHLGITVAGSQAAYAEQLGISPQYLCDVLYGRREPGDKMLIGMGLQRIVKYRVSAH